MAYVEDTGRRRITQVDDYDALVTVGFSNKIDDTSTPVHGDVLGGGTATLASFICEDVKQHMKGPGSEGIEVTAVWVSYKAVPTFT